MSDINLIAGLGNPGSRYASTRHNIGFLVLDELERTSNSAKRRFKFRSEIANAVLADHEVYLVWPQTFMNDSGRAVWDILRATNIKPHEMLVVYDDLDLAFGRIRVRPSGSAGGHNGMRSIIDTLRSREFPRVRVGIGRPAHGDPIDWVLGRWTPDERAELGSVISEAAEVVRRVVTVGVERAMNEYNGRR